VKVDTPDIAVVLVKAVTQVIVAIQGIAGLVKAVTQVIPDIQVVPVFLVTAAILDIQVVQVKVVIPDIAVLV
jgi:hypothetical protein